MMLLASCGFQPMQGQAYRASYAVDLTSVAITAKGSNATLGATTVLMDRRWGELLTAEIYDQINPARDRGEKLFQLTINFTESDVALFVNPDGTASRGDLTFTSGYTIRRLADNKVVTSGSITRISSYNTSPTADYASFVSIEDARKRGILELAQDYKLRLATLMPILNKPFIEQSKPVDEKLPALQPMRGYEDRPQGY